MATYLTPADVATRLQISKSYTCRLLTSGRIKSTKVGRLRRIDPRDLDAYMRANQTA